jgi:imidazolonepropionase-like amidohydrolase
MKTVLRNANLIDCVRPRVLAKATVVVEDGRIAQIREGDGIPEGGDADADEIDLNGAYLLPGLWDAHIHPDNLAGAPPAEQAIRWGQQLMEGMRESGITAVRSAGAAHFIDVAWKQAFDSGQYDGPRVFACGHFLTTTGGHFLTSGHALECDGPYGFVRAIREHIKRGVDHIKLNLSGGILGPFWDRHWHSFLLDEELEAAFAICRRRGYKVMAHATNPEAVKAAVKHGAHSVEHGYIMDEECVDLLAKQGTWYVPTLAISHLTSSQVANDWERRWVVQRNMPHEHCCRAEAAVDVHRKWFKRALDAGVKMALGSDIRPLKDSALLEMGLWVKDGATPWQTLLAATRNAAELCGVGAELGTVETGKRADLIVLEANPLEDILNIRSLLMVLKDGRVVSDKRKTTGRPKEI